MRTVILAGAGVSFENPSRVPLASHVISALLHRISPDDATRADLQLLANPARPDKLSPTDYLRFEALLDAIQQHADPQLNLLEFVDLYRDPNPLHYYLAERAIAGDVVLTTNFDSLLEVAIRELGREPRTVCRSEQFERMALSRGEVPIFKLHGSYRAFAAGSDSVVTDTIEATLSKIHGGKQDLGLSGEKKKALLELVRNARLLVIGYSGGDDLDIVPEFHDLAPAEVIWLEHTDGYGSEDVTASIRHDLVVTPLRELAPKSLYFRAALSAGRFVLRIVKAHTLRFMESTYGPRHWTLHRSAPPDIDAFFNNWAERRLQGPYERYAITFGLYMNLSRVQRALGLAKAGYRVGSSAAQKAKLAAMVSRALVEGPDSRDALHWANLSVSGFPYADAANVNCYVAHEAGYAYYCNNRLTEAADWYDRASHWVTPDTSLDVRAFLSHDRAILQQDLGHPDAALELYAESAEFSRASGNIRQQIFTLFQLGTLLFDEAKFTDAAAEYARASKLAWAIADIVEFGRVEHELSLLSLLAGDLVGAARHCRASLQVCRLTKQIDVALDWQQRGKILLEANKLRAATACFDRAEEAYAYATVNMRAAESELHCYRCEAELLLGDRHRAAERAALAASLAEDAGDPEFVCRADFMKVCRADFMKALVNVVSGERAEAALVECMNRAARDRYRALVLDQAALCGLYRVNLRNVGGAADLVAWAAGIYEELGNRRRAAMVNLLLTRAD
jgi:tetratricopeptide (TPR) repeat protein